MKTLKQIREASGGKEAYQKFFNSMLKKFGVSSPSELEGKKKKEFFDAIDKGWDGDNEKDETVKEAKLKGGRGKAEIDINWDGDAKDVKFAATKYKIKIKPHRDGAMLSGDKQKILAYLQGQDYAMDDEDIEDLYPEVLETYDDPDNLQPDTTINTDDNEPATDKKPKIKKAESTGKKLSAIRVAEKSGTYDEGMGKNYPVMDAGQRVKIVKIAKKHSGNMQKALKLIDKIRKGLSDNPDVMDILKKANESVSEAKGDQPGQAEYYKRVDKVNAKFGIGPHGKSLGDLSSGEVKKYFAAYDKAMKEDVNEATIHISNEITEKLKAGKGKETVGTDVDWDNVGDEKKWIKQAKSKYKVTIKKDVGKDHSGAEITGQKADIIKFLQGPMYGGVDDRDIEDMWPDLVEVNEASRYSRELRGHAKEIFNKTLEKIRKEKIRGDKDQAAAVDTIDGANLLNGRDKRTIIMALQYEAVDCDARLVGFKASVRRKEGEKQLGKVIVDRRTVGAKKAAIRSEKAKAKREEKRLKKEFDEKYPKIDYNYAQASELDKVIAKTNTQIMGETAANAVASGGVDMAPNAKNKKKGKFKVYARPNY